MTDKLWEIWREGYDVTGNSDGPALLGTQLATTFDEAVSRHIETAPDGCLFRHVDDYWTFWGCRLFDKNPVDK